MAGEHECAVEDCSAQIPAGRLMCFPHWKTLPQKLQRAVNATWKNYRRDPEAYLDARGNAIKHFRDQKPEDLLL